MKKIIFMGNKPIGYKCLNILIENSNIEILGVLTKKLSQDVWWDSKYRVAKLSKENNIPILNLDELQNMDFDFIFSVQYHKILKREILVLPKHESINLHMAPLPDYRGCNQFTFAIINQEKDFGTTLHIMDEGVDSGDILYEKRFEIDSNIVVGDLYKLTEKKSVELFEENIENIINLDYKPIPQDKLIESRSLHYYERKDIYDIKELDLSWSKEKIYRYVRALDFPPFEPPYIKFNKKKIFLTLDWE
ncbi:methionyl-tRNA formyltransferase [Halanaerobium sp. DL-01]|uniref:formyltransferase family protein n=1 Tax=Halanaerobium sp. DL-01 TaxID=1653064 RepID=UPI000DF337CC|nr:formyltransferase family protein [Halanaerobium sp. DL-01]RCW86931.1 methionyl-tRNA formyltransferase [Halanaerobium sp. DL-01]